MIVRGFTLPEAYHNALLALHENGDILDCPDWNTRTKDTDMTMVVLCSDLEPMISKLMPAGPLELEQYRQEMLYGILDFEVGNNWNYTYHDRMVSPINQIEFVIDELRRNPQSRRAVICVRRDEDIGSSDPACLQSIQFINRKGDLDCYVLFRSNDAVKATFMNAFALICLQKMIADELGLFMGKYVHHANSFHAYEKDWPTLDRYYNAIHERKPEELVYEYVGDWKESMDDCNDEIQRKVAELRERLS